MRLSPDASTTRLDKTNMTRINTENQSFPVKEREGLLHCEMYSTLNRKQIFS